MDFLWTYSGNFTLTLARASGLMTFAPFLGSAAIPARIKVGLSFVFALVIAPFVVTTPTRNYADMVPLIIGELSVGLLMGMSLQFVFEAMQLAGQITGAQAGFTLASIIDPQTNVDTPVLGLLHQNMALLIFLCTDFHHWMLRAWLHSYTIMPVGAVVPSLNSVHAMFTAAGGIFTSGIQIAAPVFAFTLALDVVLGFLGKSAPELPILFIGIAAKSVMLMVVLAFSAGNWPALLQNWFEHALLNGETLLRMMR